MANLTLSIDDELLRRARVKAAEQGTSVNAVVCDHLAHYAMSGRQEEAIRGFLELAERSNAASGPEGRTWTRESIYEEQLNRHEKQP